MEGILELLEWVERIWFSWEDVTRGSENISFHLAVEDWHTSIYRHCDVFYFRVTVYLAVLTVLSPHCVVPHLLSDHCEVCYIHLVPNIEYPLFKGDRNNKHWPHTFSQDSHEYMHHIDDILNSTNQYFSSDMFDKPNTYSIWFS